MGHEATKLRSRRGSVSTTRKAAVILLTLASTCTVLAYFVSFMPAPEWGWQGKYLSYFQFPAGYWPHRRVSWTWRGTKMILGIQSGHFWVERYSATSSTVPTREASLGGFIVRESTRDPWDGPWRNGIPLQLCHQLRVPLWLPFTLFVAFPARAFFRGPFRRWRCRRRGLCAKCSYDLTGNVSGICPECGTHM